MAQPVAGRMRAGFATHRTMRGGMAIVLVTIAAIFAVSTYITLQQIREHNQYGRTINLAGRQRMLLEEMTLAASAVAHGDETQRPILVQAEAEFDAALGRLRRGDSAQGILAPPSGIRGALNGIAERWTFLPAATRHCRRGAGGRW